MHLSEISISVALVSAMFLAYLNMYYDVSCKNLSKDGR